MQLWCDLIGKIKIYQANIDSFKSISAFDVDLWDTHTFKIEIACNLVAFDRKICGVLRFEL